MVEYICNRCGYNAKQKINLVRHLHRKNICVPILEDISIDEMKFMYGFEISKNSPQNDSKMTPIDSKMTQNESNMTPKWKNGNDSTMTPFDSIMTPFDSKNIQNPKTNEYICSYCSKSYSKNCNLRRHEKKCKIKMENENEKDKKIEELIKNQKEMKEIVEKLLLEKCNTITNNSNNTNNITNNIININNYGDEDTKYITSDYILKLLKNKPAKVIPELIKYTHFNTEHPENQNIKITNKKDSYIKVRKNDKWELQNKDETINDLIDRQQIHLMDEDIEKKIETVCNSSEKINIERCSDLYNEEDKDYMKRLYNESELIIINNS